MSDNALVSAQHDMALYLLAYVPHDLSGTGNWPSYKPLSCHDDAMRLLKFAALKALPVKLSVDATHGLEDLQRS